MRLCHVKKVDTFLAMGFVNVAAIRTAMWSEAAALLICALEARLRMYAVWQDQTHRLAQACQPGRIYMMLFVECTIRIFGLQLVDMNGNAGNVLRQTAVWARLVSGRENVPLMGVP